jgi:hypothetical protein
MGFTTITRIMTIDSIISIKKIDSIIAKYRDSIDWIKEKYPNRIDLITSLEDSIVRLNIVRKDVIVLDTKIEAKEWMES